MIDRIFSKWCEFVLTGGIPRADEPAKAFGSRVIGEPTLGLDVQVAILHIATIPLSAR